MSLSSLDGVWTDSLPAWSADAHVIVFCQTTAVLLGWGARVLLLRRQLATHHAAWLGVSALALTLALAGRWLVAL